ncbi:MAG: CatB-related O-acetyltransferase [Promethearchaeota archaeon]
MKKSNKIQPDISLLKKIKASFFKGFSNFSASFLKIYSSLSSLDEQRYFCKKYYGFDVGRHSYGFWQFCKPGINLRAIGAFCSIAVGVKIGGKNHPIEYITGHPIIYSKKWGFVTNDDRDVIDTKKKNRKVIIKNDVWIGQDATIVSGVTIGNGSVIGLGSVVTKNVPDYAIVVGNPAKIIRYRFNPEEIQKLLDIKWWDWNDARIKENINLLKDPSLFFK